MEKKKVHCLRIPPSTETLPTIMGSQWEKEKMFFRAKLKD